MKRTLSIGAFMICIVALIFLVSGCLPFVDEQPQQTGETNRSVNTVVPSFEVQENYYQGLVPFQPSETRGRLYSNLNRHRLDAERVDLGLLEIAQDHFSIDEYLFREGQVISQNDLSSLLQIEGESRLGLNPPDEPSRVLMHILEHNYVDMQRQELQGIVIGLSLTSVYQHPETGQETFYFDEELRNLGQEMANRLARVIRQREQDVPIVIALYRLEPQNNLRPGSFLSIGYVEGANDHISQWQAVDEFYLTIPSTALRDFDSELSREYQRFRERVRNFFPNHISMIGTGRFVDEQLVELTLNVSTEFASKTEVIQLTQFIGGDLMEFLPRHVHLNVYISTMNEPQSVFVRPSDGDVMMHVYR